VHNGLLTSTATLTRSGYFAFGLSNDGTLLATTGDGGRSLALWRTSDPGHPRRLAALSVPQALQVEFSPSDATMAVITSASVQLWNLHDRNAPALEGTFVPPADPAGTVLTEEEFTAPATLFVQDYSTVYVVGGDPGDLAQRLCSSLGSTITPAQWQQYAPGVPYRNPCPAGGG
jgi:hypothetical protein